MIILALVAIIVIPPEKLPEVARNVARFLNDIRRSTSGVWDDIKKDAMLKPEDLMKPANKPFNPPTMTAEVKTEDKAAEVKSDTATTEETKKHE